MRCMKKWPKSHPRGRFERPQARPARRVGQVDRLVSAVQASSRSTDSNRCRSCGAGETPRPRATPGAEGTPARNSSIGTAPSLPSAAIRSRTGEAPEKTGRHNPFAIPGWPVKAFAFEIPTELICAACDAVIPERSSRYVGLYVSKDGAIFPHLLCDPCSTIVETSKAGHARIAELVELRFRPAEGAA